MMPQVNLHLQPSIPTPLLCHPAAPPISEISAYSPQSPASAPMKPSLPTADQAWQPRELLPSDKVTEGPSQAHSQDWALQLTALQPRRGRQTSGPQRLLRWPEFLPCDTECCNSKRPCQSPHPPPSPAKEKTVSTGHPQRDSGKHMRTQTKTHGRANTTYINRRSLPDANNGVFREH